MTRARALSGAALMLAVGCGKNPTGAGRPAEIVVVAPTAPVSDTVTALLPQPLVVEVRDSTGQPWPGVTVRFVAGSTSLNGVVEPHMYLSATTPDQYRSEMETVTDGTGRAAVRVLLGRVATVGSVRIEAPTLGVGTTGSFVVRAGATVRTVVMPRDTAVYVGGSYALRAANEDRWGNATPISVTSAVYGAPGIATVAGSAATGAVAVTGAAVGRASLTVTANGQQVPVFVSVVPQGTLLAGRGGSIYLFELDGAGFRRVVQGQDARSPRWLPDGQSFVFGTGLGHAFVSTLAGAVRPLVPGNNPLAAELWPHPSRDGQWIYFGGYAGAEFRGYPHRMRADGTGLLQMVPGFTPDGQNQSHPSTSPTGDRVVFFREAVGDSRSVTLRIINMQTGQTVLQNVPGHAPEWSHGDSIAYLDTQGGTWGPIRLMSSAGQGHRAVSGGTSYDFGFDWSPNDQWIVARDLVDQRLEVVRVATGERIPLPYTTGMYDPAWKP
ncbi:MAG TPA: hypothetical protein VF006_31360 [Longimicrobium sp.]